MTILTAGLDQEGNHRDACLGYSFLRLTIGLNILMHGVSRILAGPSVFANSLIPEFAHTPLPPSFLHLFGMTLPWVETAIGLFLFLGLYTRIFAMAGCLLILTLTFGTTLREDFAVAGVQLTYAAIFAALLVFCRYNVFSADALLFGMSSRGNP